MKYFTKALLLIAAVAQLNVMAQAPSQRCIDALRNFENTNEGRVFTQCAKAGKNICNMQECKKLSLPNNFATECSTEVEKAMVDAIKNSVSKYNSMYKNVCSGTKTIPGKQIPGKKNDDKKNDDKKKDDKKKDDKKKDDKKKEPANQSNNAPSAPSASSAPAAGPAANAPSTNAPATNGPAANGPAANGPATTTPATTSSGSNNTSSGFGNVISGNSTNTFNGTNTFQPQTINTNNVSAGMKLSYSLVTVFVLAAFNLLL